MTLDELETPALLLDAVRMERNIARMGTRVAALGAALRPHVKTAKSIEVARCMTTNAQPGPITVSTLAEAEHFAAHGARDILYAVGIAPNKVHHVIDLRKRGVPLMVITDNVDAARAACTAAHEAGDRLPVLIEIDCDGHRSGVKPDDTLLIEVARAIDAAGGELRGVMTHAGSSYNCRSVDAIAAVAEKERAAVVDAAARLRAAGFACPVVSVGSTPTATYAKRLDGVTEVRAGVFVFFDLVMAGIDVCATDDIAISVLTSVIGHQPDRGWAIVDAGWMAMSRDRGTAAQRLDQGYGLACDADGVPLDDVIMIDANQEHGILAHRSREPARMPHLPVGTLVRILPNHACATAAQHRGYHVVRGTRTVEAYWDRISGW